MSVLPFVAAPKPKSLPVPSATGPKRLSFSLQLKYDVLISLQIGHGLFAKELIKQHKISETTVSHWKSESKEIKKNYESGLWSGSRLRFRESDYPEVEKSLGLWVNQFLSCKTTIPLTGKTILAEANYFLKQYHPKDEHILDRNWMSRFCTRRQLKL
jgi:hypothetical protein